MNEKRQYDSTVARIAGNIMSAYECYDLTPDERKQAAEACVAMARAIVAETIRTEVGATVDAVDPEFIVRACNAHYDLLACCKAALGAFERNDAIDWSELEDAIDKAEGH